MTPERWQQIDQLFHDALACEPAQRADFLASACGGDEELRLEVQSLISSHEQEESFIETPAGDIAAELLDTHRSRFEFGQQISNYKIVSKLGSGGMGEVYLAIDNKLGRKVALKLLPEMFTIDAERVRRFKQEARAASALNHPNILTIHEINEDGVWFIATEFVDGQTLRERMKAGPLDVSTALEVSEQIASALAAAQTEGIIHRDIKPENIMLRRDGIVKLLDFGLAKLAENRFVGSEESTQSLLQTGGGVLLGTTHYMSPEQARGQHLDSRTDIFSLGAVLYEMIAGEKAFKGETSSDVIASVLRTQPPLLSESRSDVPPELQRIVSKALQKDPGGRYQTVNELLFDLNRLKQKRALEVQRSSSVEVAGGDTTNPARYTVPEKVVPTLEIKLPPHSTSKTIVNVIKRHKVAASLIVGIVVVSAIVAVVLFAGRKPAINEKDTILIADFVNATGDSVFDGTLKQALSVQLVQSPFLNIFPEERIREALAYMGKPQDERVTRAIGREICERQGLKAMLLGSIASIGNSYVITLEAVTQTGDSIAHEQSQAESKEKVLTSLGAATTRLRQKLGESLSSIQKYDVHIEQATTSSLDALKAFTLGNEARAKARDRESLAFYQRAVDLDPNFAMAYARIGVFHANQGEIESATNYMRKAYDLRDRVSERERFYISEKYHSYIEGDILKALDILQAWARLYPNDYIPHNNLAMNYLFVSRYEESLKESKEALKLRPNYASGNANLMAAFIGLGRYEEAEQVAKQAAQVNPNSLTAHYNNYMFAFLRGDSSAMNNEVAWSRDKEEAAPLFWAFAQISFYSGRLKEGDVKTRQAVALSVRQDQPENAAQTLLTLGTAQSLFGKCDAARSNVKPALTLSRGRNTLLGAALNLLLCNDAAQGQALLDEAVSKWPKDTITVLIIAPALRALIENSRGNHEKAIDLLELVRAYDFGTLVGPINNYVRGQIYLDLKRGSEAAVEFQTIIERRGIDPFNPMRPLSYLGLARAAALAGDLPRSRKAYQDFLALWKDGDQDLPILIQAKKEYERLNQ